MAAGGDFYLCPLSQTQLSLARRHELLLPVWLGTQVLQEVSRPGPKGQPDELVAQGFCVDMELTAEVEQKEVRWTERRWLVRSQAYAVSRQEALERRLSTAETCLRELPTRRQGKKPLFHAELVAAAGVIMKRERVEDLLRCTARAVVTRQKTRGYGGRPATEKTDVSFEIEVRRDDKAIEEKKREMGWQVYSSNALGMGLTQVVWAYRGQYRIENDWSRLKGRPLGLTPLYLQDEVRIEGLVYVLSVALRVLTLLEWQVREGLRKDGSKLEGVYAGQAGRKTVRPSAELLLGVLKTISLSVIEINGQIHTLLSPLTKVQKRLLKLWELPTNLYEKITRGFPKTPPKTSEP